MSMQENPNADQRLQGGTSLPLHMTFKPLEHNLLCMMSHAMFSATAYAFVDIKRNKNQNEQAKTYIAHAVYTCNSEQMMPMPDIRLKFIYGSYLPRHAACSTKPQRIVSDLRVFFLQTLSAGRIWDITKGCSTSRPRRMKTSTSSSRTSLVGHLELLRKEPAYDHLRALVLSIGLLHENA